MVFLQGERLSYGIIFGGKFFRVEEVPCDTGVLLGGNACLGIQHFPCLCMIMYISSTAIGGTNDDLPPSPSPPLPLCESVMLLPFSFD